MSPEQVSGRPLDARSDIFSAGVLLFELTTGRRLFKAASEFETLKLICEREYPRPTEIQRDYPAGLERITLRALSKPLDARYASARAMQADLEAFAREHRVAVSQVSLARWMQFLFEDQIDQRSEALQDVKQVADAIAAHSIPPTEGAVVTATRVTATTSAAPQTKRGGSAASRRWSGSVLQRSRLSSL